MNSWTCTLPLTPVAKGRPRLGKFGTYTPAKTRKAESNIKSLLVNAKAPHFGDKALCVALEFTFQRPKSVSAKKRPHPNCGVDLDNVIKGFLDSANGILWDDDRQVVTLIARKVYGERPSIKATIWLKDRPGKIMGRAG